MFHLPELNNSHYNDCYFSYDEGFEESCYIFIEGNNLISRIKPNIPFIIGETGFGTGLNLLALINQLKINSIKDFKIYFFSVELYPLSPKRITELISQFSEKISDELGIWLPIWENSYNNLHDGFNEISFKVFGGEINLNLFIGDVNDMFNNCAFSADAWFLDGHSPDKNPAMWQPNVMSNIGENSKTGTTIATFTAAGLVKRGLRAAGFEVKRRKGFGGKRHMVIGHFIKEDQPLEPIEFSELEIL